MPRFTATLLAAFLAASATTAVLAFDVPAFYYYEPRSLSDLDASDASLHPAIARAVRQAQVDAETETILRRMIRSGHSKQASSSEKQNAAQAVVDHSHYAKMSEQTKGLVKQQVKHGEHGAAKELGDINDAQRYHTESAIKEMHRFNHAPSSGSSSRQ